MSTIARTVGSRSRVVAAIVLCAPLAATVGCSANEDLAFEAASIDENSAPADGDAVTLVRVEVHPAATDDGELLPQVYNLPSAATEATLRVADSVTVSGEVAAYVVNPWRGAAPPGDALFVEGATVRVSAPESVLDRETVTDDGGAYRLDVVPSDLATVLIEHEDPLVAPWAGTLDALQNSTLDVDLGQGVAVWGWVSDAEGAPLADATVFATSDVGLKSGFAATNDEGFYLLRVPEGVWTVTSLGRSDGRDPVISAAQSSVTSRGAQIDVIYPTLEQITVGGRVVSSSGDGLDNVTISLHAVSLDGFEDGATLDLEVDTDSNGNWDTRVHPGVYDVTYAPSDATDATALLLEGVRVDDDLGEQALAAMIDVVGTVVDSAHKRVPGAAIEVIEAAGARRWTTYSDDRGAFAIRAPASLVEVVATPSAERPDLALTRSLRDLSEDPAPAIVLTAGNLLSARVVDERDQALPYAWIEIHDQEGRLWGATITDDEGWFDVAVSPGLSGASAED